MNGMWRIPAFKKPLKKSEFNRRGESKLREFQSDPRFVVRMDDNASREHVREIKELFDELRKFGVRVPVNIVIAKNQDNENALFVITDKVSTAKKSPAEKERYYSEFRSLLRSWLKYFGLKAATRGSFLTDVDPHHMPYGFSRRQYVYGKIRDDNSNHIYLVDTDPHYIKSDSPMYPHVLYDRISQLSRTLLEEEQRSGISFAKEIERCNRLIQQLSDEEEAYNKK